MKKEDEYKLGLIDRLGQRFPGCFILKNDPQWMQGVPDMLILYKDRWAMLELKRQTKSSRRPNQGFYIDTLNELSFASFISPETEEEVLDDLQRAFESRRPTRIS